MLFSKNNIIYQKDTPILSSHRCRQALTRSSSVDSAVPVPLFSSDVYPVTSTWLLQFPLRSPRSTKGLGSMFTFLSALPFNNTTLLLVLYLFSSSPPVKLWLQVMSLWSQNMSTCHLNSIDKGKLASPWSWAVLNPNGSVCFHVPRPVRVVGTQAFTQCLLEALVGIFKDLGSGVLCHPLMRPVSLHPWVSSWTVHFWSLISLLKARNFFFFCICVIWATSKE